MNKQAIIQDATARLHENTGIKAEWTPGPPETDGILDLTIEGKKATFFIEVKLEPRAHQVEQIRHMAKNYQNFMVVAYRLFPAIKQQLKELNIAYLDAAGNIYINTPKTFIWIEGNKLQPEQQKPITNRAFTRKGLETIFHLLLWPDDINIPYRQLAAKTGTALGNITNVITGLEEAGFVLHLNGKNKLLQNKKELLNRWITGYGQTLKPALYLGNYIRRGDWRSLPLTGDTVWGGESAAEQLTNYLVPQQLTAYTKEPKANLVAQWKLLPGPNANLVLYEKFWTDTGEHFAPPLLVYADLLLTNDPRCIETANMIYNQYLKHEFE